jgi:cytidylate kinase
VPDHIIIAIDGYSSSGKSTLAKQLSHALHFDYVDSGAFYRAVTFYFLKEKLNWNEDDQVKEALSNITIDFHFDPVANECRTRLNGEDVEREIRSLEVSNAASSVSAVPRVREFVTRQLRSLAGKRNLIMDGRDIGTVVFPHADLKIFMVADPKVRSERRFKEMKGKGSDVSESQIEENLSGRDELDTTRPTAPLKQADDAVVLDNSGMTRAGQFDFALQLVNERLGHLLSNQRQHK